MNEFERGRRSLARRLFASSLAGAALLALAACDGGGADDGSGAAADPGAPAADPGGSGIFGSFYVSSFAGFEARAAWFRDSVARFTVQLGNVTLPDHPVQPGNQAGTYQSYPLASSRVDYAQAAGLTGAGQTISIVDAGFRQGHEAFAGKSVSTTGAPPVDPHGTAVASVAAGNSATMVGVAPGADLHFGDWDSIDLAAATLQALALGAVAQNNSWGYANTPIGLGSFNDIFADPFYPELTDYLAALDLYAAQGVVVFALSNDATATTAQLLEALPVVRPTLEPGWLAVGNALPVFDTDGISSAAMVSAACLEAAPWCLVADGFWYAASSASNTSYSQVAGASFAAPQVSGALALLAEAFPGLTPHQLRLRLLASANNDFSNFGATGSIDLDPGAGVFLHDYSDIFGHGFLDLRAALLPIGPVVTTLADGSTVKVETLGLSTGAALGDALGRGMAAVDFAVSDSLSGEFRMPGKSLTANAAPQPLGATLLARAAEPSAADARPRLFADHRGMGLVFTGSDSNSDGNSGGGAGVELLLPPPGSGAGSYGFALSQPLLSGPLRLDLALKFARDDGSLMGFGGAQGGADMLGAALSLRREFAGGAFFGLGAEFGLADLGRPAAFSDVSRIGYDAFSATFGQRDILRRGDRISLGVALPVAVSSGTATLALPVLAEDGRTLLAAAPIGLAPSERQVDVSLRYSVPLGARSDLGIVLQHSENYGNRAGFRDSGAALAWTVRF